MAARYEQQLRAQQHQPTREDLSDMLADHVARQKVTIELYILNHLVCEVIFTLYFFRFRVKENVNKPQIQNKLKSTKSSSFNVIYLKLDLIINVLLNWDC